MKSVYSGHCIGWLPLLTATFQVPRVTTVDTIIRQIPLCDSLLILMALVVCWLCLFSEVTPVLCCMMHHNSNPHCHRPKEYSCIRRHSPLRTVSSHQLRSWFGGTWKRSSCLSSQGCTTNFLISRGSFQVLKTRGLKDIQQTS